MNLDKLYWRQDGLFDSSFIKKVKELAGQQKLKDLQLQDKNRELLTRDSKGCFINSTWLQTQLAPVINDTNKTLGWNFKLSKFEDLHHTINHNTILGIQIHTLNHMQMVWLEKLVSL